MEQIKFSFDPITVEKIKSSAKIVLATEAVVVVPLATNEVTQFLLKNDPIDWRTIAATAIGIFSTWIIASVRQWMKGKEIDTSMQ